ncbi:hypothetical protein CAPTEDRAFT_223541 [Capitella teleta]|uniref:C3H1-type domain-containing protein n=1 Tax=Capitella teleta TaxID=283909 RepID=R7TEG4_CAPTE|nr:hypothetical protein CAPTEDRAFT_223541 [Capitella teleta]|eukprot:ELT92119.1 hypothetical protein CAPTEDRAFT_223541 [Capitella teleta]
MDEESMDTGEIPSSPEGAASIEDTPSSPPTQEDAEEASNGPQAIKDADEGPASPDFDQDEEIAEASSAEEGEAEEDGEASVRGSEGSLVSSDEGNFADPVSARDSLPGSPVSSSGSGELDLEDDSKVAEKSPAKSGAVRMNRLSMHDDHHGELDYEEDEEIIEQMTRAHKGDDDLRENNDQAKDVEGSSEDGELSDDDCEEGEIKEDRKSRDRSRHQQQQQTEADVDSGPQICRFFLRGNCTWGAECRYVHPSPGGGRDRWTQGPLAGRLGHHPSSSSWEQIRAPIHMEQDSPPHRVPPPPTPAQASPPTESAWERGLRHAKELRRKAMQRKETEENFEEKKMTLSLDAKKAEIEVDKQSRKDDKRLQSVVQRMSPDHKDPYYDPGYEDDYYLGNAPSNSAQRSRDWDAPSELDSYEARWSRDPDSSRAPRDKFPRDRRFPDSKTRNRGADDERYQADKYDKYAEKFPPPVEKYLPGNGRENPSHRGRNNNAPNNNSAGGSSRNRGDVWADPWSRVKKSPKRTKTSRSGSRRRSHSKGSLSSSVSSSYSSRSRSRSSSYSSYSSASSISRSSSFSSRSRSPQPRGRRGPGSPPRRGGAGGRGGMGSAGRGSQGRPEPKQPKPAKKVRPAMKPTSLGAAVAQTKGAQAKVPKAPPPSHQGPSLKPPKRGQGAERGREPHRAAPGRGLPRISHKRSFSSSGSSRSFSSSRSRSWSRSSSSNSVSSVSSRSSASSKGSPRKAPGSKKTGKAPLAKKGKAPPSGRQAPPPNRQAPPTNRQAPPPSKQAVKRHPPPPSRKEPSRSSDTKAPVLKSKAKPPPPPPSVDKPALSQQPPQRKREDYPPVAKKPRPEPVRLTIPKKERLIKHNTSPLKEAPKPPPPPKPVVAMPEPKTPTKRRSSTSSRREELLQQLKAVEDAIARKRSKVN